MMVVATDAPLNARSLERLAMRAMMGLARTGSFAHNGSGDYVIAFSTNQDVRRPRSSRRPVTTPELVNESMSPLFAATVEATEEAIYNAYGDDPEKIQRIALGRDAAADGAIRGHRFRRYPVAG
jgi:D-aminopeptidase